MKRKKVITISVICFIILLIGIFLANILPFLYKTSLKEFSIIYPYNDSVFPPDIAPPTFIWEDESRANIWKILIEFQDNGNPITVQTATMNWTPERDVWEVIKKRSLEGTARVTISGIKNIYGVEVKGADQSISMKTSKDEVGAPIFFRSVPLPFEHAINHMDSIKWCLGDVSSEKPPKVVLENMAVCGNCHSFSADGNL
ncbi:hypothetical protein KAS50_02440, partial [bacterium]|nr:hypothetical protein [bacterium]